MPATVVTAGLPTCIATCLPRHWHTPRYCVAYASGTRLNVMQTAIDRAIEPRDTLAFTFSKYFHLALEKH